MTVTREYLPGLRLAQQFIAESVSEEAASDLNVLIAQASTAPEQEPVAYLHQVVCGDAEPDQALSFEADSFPLSEALGYRSLSHAPLYTHADPSEVEQLRAELTESDKCVVRALNERDAALQKLAESQELLSRCESDSQLWYKEFGEPSDGGYQAAFAEIDAFLSATARPAVAEQSATNDQIAAVMLQRGTPSQQREALQYAAQPADGVKSDE